MKIQPTEIRFLYRTVISLLVFLGLALFVILCFIARIYAPACLAYLQQLPSQIGLTW